MEVSIQYPVSSETEHCHVVVTSVTQPDSLADPLQPDVRVQLQPERCNM